MNSRVLAPLIWGGGFIVLWELAVYAKWAPVYLIAAPSNSIFRIFTDASDIWHALVSTLTAIGLGFTLGAAAGILLALLIVSSRTIERLIYPLIVVIETLPKIAFAPLMIVWFGFTIYPKLILSGIAVFFPILVDSITGFKNIDERKYYLAKSMGMNYLQTLFNIRIPSALPNIFAGLRISLIASVTVVVVVEYLLGNTGIGFLVLQAIELRDTDLIFAAMIVTALLGVILARFLDLVEVLVLPWRKALQH